LACELRMHSAWKANFDAVQFANTELDSDVLSNMGSHLSYLQEYKVLPEATLDQISECFICPKKKVSKASLMAALCLMQVDSVACCKNTVLPADLSMILIQSLQQLCFGAMRCCSAHNTSNNAGPFTRLMRSVSVHVGNGNVCRDGC